MRLNKITGPLRRALIYGAISYGGLVLINNAELDLPNMVCADPVAGPPVRQLRDPMPWTPYADWIFTVVSTGSLLLIAWLVLRPRP
ncbi:MAG: hypothetical protein RLZZ515_1573 [Cyanobacteriota bacterium]